MTKCKQKMQQAIQALAQDYAAKGWPITIGAADSHPDPAAGEAWTAQVAELFPGCDIQYRPLPFSIGCHIGPGAFGLTVSRRLGLRIDDIEANQAYAGSGLSVYSVSVTICSAELKKYKTHVEIIEALSSLYYIYHIEEMH